MFFEALTILGFVTSIANFVAAYEEEYGAETRLNEQRGACCEQGCMQELKSEKGFIQSEKPVGWSENCTCKVLYGEIELN